MKEKEIKIGDEVWWHDPDHGICSGWGLVQEINGEVIFLVMASGGATEAFADEIIVSFS